MTPREPDRFEAIVDDWDRRFNHPASNRSIFDKADLLAYLRAAESSALERAAQVVEEAHQMWRLRDIAQEIRALIPPAAAPDKPAGAPHFKDESPCAICKHGLFHHRTFDPGCNYGDCRCAGYAEPAAAPAACPRCGGDIDHGRNCAGEPAAETCPLYCGATPAAPGSHHMNDCGLYAYPAPAQGTEALLRECDDVLARIQGHGCPPSDESIAALRAKLRSRAAPAAEGK